MTTLRDLLLDSRDGEWGKGEPFDDSVLMQIIRGTDFEDMRQGTVDRMPVRYIAPRAAARKALRPWDILIETAGGSKDRPTGRTVLLTPSRYSLFDNPVTCASFARFLRVDPLKADPAFVFWLLQDMYERRELLQFHTQHTGVARFQFTTFADGWPVKPPPIFIQRRIANILSAYDELLQANTRRIAILEELGRRLFEQWFIRPIGKLPLPSDRLSEWDLPVGWAFKQLSDVSHVTMGQSPPSSEYNSEGVGRPFHQGVTEFQGYFHGTRLFCKSPDRFRKAQEGDILFSVRAPVGRIALALHELVLGRGLSAIRATTLSQAYLLIHLRSQFSKPDMFGGGTIYKAVTKDEVLSVPILVPSNEQLRGFDAVAKDCWNSIRSLHLANINLRTTRDVLLPKLISGKIKVRAAEDALETAAA